MFDSFEVHKVLVIAPIRVASFSWPAEMEKWDHLKGMRYSVERMPTLSDVRVP